MRLAEVDVTSASACCVVEPLAVSLMSVDDECVSTVVSGVTVSGGFLFRFFLIGYLKRFLYASQLARVCPRSSNRLMPDIGL